MASVRTLVLFAALTGIILSDGCDRPTLDQTELTTIRSGAVRLMQRQATRSSGDDPAPADWPIAVQRLRPDRVIVRRHSVDIITTPWFDGGWGYYVTDDRSPSTLPNPCYRPVGKDIYWHDPC